eukprot:6185210-Pleurochrysis_carterae.AAC.5
MGMDLRRRMQKPESGTKEKRGDKGNKDRNLTLHLCGRRSNTQRDLGGEDRGRYMKTEEELLKIRLGEKPREVTDMMKTQGVSLMTLTDTHLSQEGINDVGKFLQQEGLGGYCCQEGKAVRGYGV